VTAITVLVTEELGALALSSAVVAGFVALLAAAPVRALPAAQGDRAPYGLGALTREVWPYATSTVFSATYSQAPTVLLGLVASVPTAAVYAICTRLTQPLELVPNAIASTFLPRLVRAERPEQLRLFKRQITAALVTATTAALAIAIASPVLLPLSGTSFDEAGAVLLILALVLPVKFTNYQLVAVAVAQGRIRKRVVASAVVALVSVVGVFVLAAEGAVAVASLSLGCELLLAVLLLRAASLR
jgi:O-antigen/teichoic acid export membrane protein